MRRNLGEMSFLRLHTAVAITAFALPLMLILGTHTCGMQPSMSECWYTTMRDVFSGCLYVCGAFFLVNQGYDLKDNLLYKLCGICFLIIANVPCEIEMSDCVTFIPDYLPKYHTQIHYAAASILFSTLGYISMFQFTKSSGRYTEEKHKRNLVYEICGVFIFFSIIVLIASNFILISKYITFIMEIVMLYSFATAFIVKGTKGRIIKYEDD